MDCGAGRGIAATVLALGLAGCADDEANLIEATSGGSSGGSATGSTDGPSSSGEEAPPFCVGATHLVYDPPAGTLDAYPDDFFTVEASTPTGLRLDLRLGQNVNPPGLAAAFTSVYAQASSLDGFGTTAAAYLRFDGPVDRRSLPEIDGVADAGDGLVMVDLDADPPAFVPLVWKLVHESETNAATTLVLEPVVPLSPRRRYGVALTTAVTSEAGDCLAPSETMQSLLAGESDAPALARTQAAVASVTEVLVDLGVVEYPQELTAVVAFTTQSTVNDSATIAAEIRSTSGSTYVGDAPCEDPGTTADYVTCRGTIDVLDFTDAAEHVAADLAPAGGYDLPVTIHVPKAGTAPWPTIVYGHGLGGDRGQAAIVASFAAGQGYAVIAVDAPKHGEHPDIGESAVTDFFGLSNQIIDPFDAFKARDNFRQATYDKLQVLEAIRAGIDVDDDTNPDLDFDRLHYLGVSLGGIMGAEFLAFAPEVDVGIVIVPGARVTGIVQYGAAFSGFIATFASAATDGEIARFFPFLQSVIDRGDPGVYAGHILPGRRLVGFDGQAPQVLMQMVLSDDTVPNVSNGYYARALGVPVVGPQRLAIGVPNEPTLPTSGNVDASHTAGVFQFDELETGVMASHANIATSAVAQEQIRRFLRSWADDGVAEIIDPY